MTQNISFATDHSASLLARVRIRARSRGTGMPGNGQQDMRQRAFDAGGDS